MVNMRLILILMLILIAFITPASALVFEGFADPVGVGYYTADDMLVVESAATTGTISGMTLENGNMYLLINDLPYPEDATVGIDGKIYFVLKDGRVYKSTSSYGITSFVDDYNTSFVLLGDMDSLSMARGIVSDGAGNIYSHSDFEIYQFSYPSYTAGIYATLTGVYSSYTFMTSVGLHPDGILGVLSESGGSGIFGAGRIYLVNDTSSTIIQEWESAASVNDYISGITAVNNKDIYFTLNRGSGYTIQRMNYSDSYSLSTISSIPSSNKDIIVDDYGIIYVPTTTEDQISTYSTIDLIGGFYDDGSITPVVSTDSTGYEHGDTVTVTYDHNAGGYVIVQHLVTGNTYHLSGDFTGSSEGNTWSYYIPTTDPTGLYNVYLMADYATGAVIADMVSYTVSPASSTTSYIDALASSTDLYKNVGIAYRTVNESIISIINPLGVEVFNETVNSSVLTYTYYNPVVNAGTYTVYLHDDTTLSDTFIAFNVDAPDVPSTDPDPATNETIIEDIIEEDETMTEYFEAKFRDFAPTAWGIFLLSIVLWLVAILSSFGGSSSKRR